MLLDWLIKFKRSTINVLLQIVYFQEVLNVSDMEYFMNPSMFRQFNVYNIVKESDRMYLSGNLALSTFIRRLLVFMGHTLVNKKSSQKWNLVPRFLRLYINDCFCFQHLNLTITLSDLFNTMTSVKILRNNVNPC